MEAAGVVDCRGDIQAEMDLAHTCLVGETN